MTETAEIWYLAIQGSRPWYRRTLWSLKTSYFASVWTNSAAAVLVSWHIFTRAKMLKFDNFKTVQFRRACDRLDNDFVMHARSKSWSKIRPPLRPFWHGFVNLTKMCQIRAHQRSKFPILVNFWPFYRAYDLMIYESDFWLPTVKTSAQTANFRHY